MVQISKVPLICRRAFYADLATAGASVGMGIPLDAATLAALQGRAEAPPLDPDYADLDPELVVDLVAANHILAHNGVLDSFGLGWDAIHAANPRTIMVRMPAFGLAGPWRDRPGFAQTMEQATGMAWMTGHLDGPPIIPRGVCDPVAGLHAAFAAIAALAVRDRTEVGMQIESATILRCSGSGS